MILYVSDNIGSYIIISMSSSGFFINFTE
jgi:hypothetical protein